MMFANNQVNGFILGHYWHNTLRLRQQDSLDEPSFLWWHVSMQVAVTNLPVFASFPALKIFQ